MKTTMKFLAIGLALIALTFTSCSKDGEIGPMGPAGQDGTNGTEGNANVMALKYDLTMVSGNSFILDVPEITEDVLNNYSILTYLKRNDGSDEYNPIPSTFVGIRHVVRYKIGQCKLDFARADYAEVYNYSAGNLIELRIILIAPNSISGKNASMDHLKKMGVDTNDYNAVLDYFDLEYW